MRAQCPQASKVEREKISCFCALSFQVWLTPLTVKFPSSIHVPEHSTASFSLLWNRTAFIYKLMELLGSLHFLVVMKERQEAWMSKYEGYQVLWCMPRSSTLGSWFSPLISIMEARVGNPTNGGWGFPLPFILSRIRFGLFFFSLTGFVLFF